VTGCHGLVGFAGFGFIKRGVFVAAPGTGEDRNTGQRTNQPVKCVTHDTPPFR
jgi:hypothetical protein